MSKYTPGPWSYETDSTNSILIVDSDQTEICGIIADNDADLLTELEWANAHLITAAPELLEVLTACKNIMKEPDDLMKLAVWQRIVEDAEVAIAKALGQC